MESDHIREEKSTGGNNWNLSCCSIAALILIVIGIHALLIFGNYTGYLVCLVAHFCLLFPLLRWWYQSREHVPLDAVVRGFGTGYILMSLGVSVMLYVTSLILSSTSLTQEYLLSFLYILAIVGSEEFFKVYFAKNLKLSNLETNSETAGNLIEYMAIVVGYVLSNIVGVMMMIGQAFYLLSFDNFELESGIEAIMGLYLVLFIAPVHILSGCMIGLNTARKLSFPQIGLEPFLLRSLLTSLLMLADGIGLYWNFIAMLLISAVFIGVMVYRVKIIKEDLPQEYIQHVGYPRVLNYGAVPRNDLDQDSKIQQDQNLVQVNIC